MNFRKVKLTGTEKPVTQMPATLFLPQLHPMVTSKSLQKKKDMSLWWQPIIRQIHAVEDQCPL